MGEGNTWAGTTHGNGWMHKWLIRVLRYSDVRIWYVFASIFVIPVYLILRPGCGITYRYFRNHFGYSIPKAFWCTYVNHCMFSQVVIDRFAMYAGKKFDVDIEGHDSFLALARKEAGFIQLSAHVGNYEIAGYSLVAETKPFNALVFSGEKKSVMENRMKMFSRTNIRMIPVKEDMSHLFEIDDALRRGETLSMPADRIWGSKKSIELEFLGGKAKFPAGPFSVATMRGLDVLSVNVMKTSWRRYNIYVKPLCYDKNSPRKKQTKELAGEYVKVLESVVRKYPTQWYNYFEFWS